MNLIFRIIALGMFAAPFGLAETTTSPAPKTVVIIPIEGAITKATTYVVRRGVKQALEQKADALILRMDTPGGEAAAALDIMDIIAKFEPQAETYTLVTREAYSAGAFLAASTRHIYMQPSTVIGAATPVVMGQGGVQELPPKMVSAMAAKIRVAAERHGHDTEVFDAMVNKQIGLVKDGKELVVKGDILTLTDKEASISYGTPPRPLLSAGTVDSIDALTTRIAGADAVQLVIEPTGLERISGFIVMLSPLLLSAALLCGYIEFKTPGFGIFGVLGIILALIFFFGHSIAGLSGQEYMVVFLIGVLLIAVELFILPGFIVPGLVGTLLVVFALLKAMVDRYPSDPVIPTLPMLQLPVTNFSLALAVTIFGVLLLARVLPHTPLARDLVLDAVNATALPLASFAPQPGTTGRALSTLRPGGTGDFGGAPLEVTTEGVFLEAGTPIRVLRVEGNQIVVEAA
jgi:membrane-bound serine protease (ClpP class)